MIKNNDVIEMFFIGFVSQLDRQILNELNVNHRK